MLFGAIWSANGLEGFAEGLELGFEILAALGNFLFVTSVYSFQAGRQEWIATFFCRSMSAAANLWKDQRKRQGLVASCSLPTPLLHDQHRCPVDET